MSNSTTGDKGLHSDQIYIPKKTPKDYFFDFFMLFLAVTLGFFVNNLSENQSERQREKQYMTSLINDLISDTTQIQEIHTSIKNRIRGIDSVMSTLENRNQKYFLNNLYLYSFRYLNSVDLFTGSDRTISQLKSAGGLRLIQKKGESDKIVQYYSSMENVEFNTQYCMKVFYRILDSEEEMFDFAVLRIKGQNIDSLRHSKKLKLLIDEPLRINHFYNQILMYTSVLISYNKLITDLGKEADSLIVFTKRSYKIN